MKQTIALILLLLSFQGFASHIVGGEMTYQYIGPGLNPNTKQYKITLRLFRDEHAGGAPMPGSVLIGIFDGMQQYPAVDISYLVNKTREDTVAVSPFPACVVNADAISYHVGIYELNVDLPDNANGYTATFQTCCRVMPLENVDTVTAAGTGSTYTCYIPPILDESPAFSSVVDLICNGKPFTLDFSATDADSDSLVYSFCSAYDGGGAQGSGLYNPSPPPYNSVPYYNGFTALEPLGAGVSIDPNTGIISGVAPAMGEYLVGVCVKSYRNGVLIGEHLKDFILKIGDCDFASAQLIPQPTSCDGFTVDFANGNQSPLNQDYFWDFGVPSLTDDTSNLPNPTFTYPDTGTYVYKLVVNRNQPCGDSMTQTIKVYPGFFPGFSWSGQCVNTEIQFMDTTATNFGLVDSWSWDFGDPSTSDDTSSLQDPFYTYPSSGSRSVKLIVSNSEGCRDSVSIPLNIVSKPVVTNLFNDSTYCGNDTIQLHASSHGNGTFSWSPGTNILNANTADPLVFPTLPSEYVLTFDQSGCSVTDTVRLNPLFDFTSSISASATDICEEDTVSLTAVTNHLPSKFSWSPVSSLSSVSSGVTQAFPADTTSYTLYSVWGKNCFDTATLTIAVKKLAIPNAGGDTAFCISSGGVMLGASGGDNYTWTPASYLSDANIPNPIASPSSPTVYKVSVGVNGCSKRRTDSVLVSPVAAPKISLLFKDTTYCGKDTIQLRASSSAAGVYSWSPSSDILNGNTADPLVFPTSATEYIVTFDGGGCTATDTVRVNPLFDLTTSVSSSSNAVCEGDTVSLSATANHTSAIFSWSPVLSVSSPSGAAIKAFPANTTTYTLQTTWGKNCIDTSSTTISVKSLPRADAGSDTAFCVSSGGVTLMASGGDDYIWTPASGLSDPNMPNPVASPASPTVYTVSVGVKGCSKRSSDSVLVTPISAANVSLLFKDTTYCGKDTIQLRASSSAAGTYSWSPSSNILNANTANPLVFPSATTEYIVTFDGGGCTAKDTVRVNPLFDLTSSLTTSSNSICEGDTVLLSAVANHPSAVFSWSPASSLSSPSSAITKAFPSNNTTYTLQTRWGKKCIDTSSTTISVKALPKADAGPDAAFCVSSGGIGLSASGGDDYIWRPASGLSDPNIPNPVATPQSPTWYTVSVGVVGCINRREDSVLVTPLLPQITLPNDTLMCSFDTLQLTAVSPTATSFFWTPAYNISNQNTSTVKVSPDVPTTYFVQVKDANNCTNTDSVFVDVQLLSLDAGIDTTICRGDPVKLGMVSNALQYKWIPASTLDDDLSKTPVATPLSTTTYFVTGTIGTCRLTDSVTITVAPYPTANAGLDTAVCAGGTAQLKASGGSIYIWTPALDFSDNTISNPLVSPTGTTTYTLTVSDTLGCPKSASDDVTVTTFSAVNAYAGRDTTIFQNEPLQLHGSGGTSFLWTPPTGLNNPAISDPITTLINSQQYVLKVTNAEGCSGTDTINITVNKIPVGLYIPNAFTPNGDNLNDVFKAVAIGIKSLNYFNIYNRFGELVFSTKQLGAGWDGSLRGIPQDQGVYVWIIEGIDFQGNKISKKGIVTLIR